MIAASHPHGGGRHKHAANHNCRTAYTSWIDSRQHRRSPDAGELNAAPHARAQVLLILLWTPLSRKEGSGSVVRCWLSSLLATLCPTRSLGTTGRFRRMVNDSILSVRERCVSLRKLSLLSYNQLAHYDSPSCYKLSAYREQQNLASRKKSLREDSVLGAVCCETASSYHVTASRRRMED